METQLLWSQTLAADTATLFDDLAAGRSRRTGEESVGFSALSLLWLIGSFSHYGEIRLCT